MRKYWAVMRMTFANTVINRGAVILWRFGNVISLVAMIAVWMTAKSSGLIGGYSKSELIAYYFLAIYLYAFVWWTPIPVIKEEINNGFLGPKYLIKPISYFWHKFSEELGWHFVSVAISTIMIIIPGYFLWGDIKSSLTLVNLFPAILATLLGALVCFNFIFMLAMFTFWTSEVFGISSFFWVGVSIFGGHAFPISFYPMAIRNIVNMLPFRYIFSFPLEIFTGRVYGMDLIIGFIFQVFWVLVLYLLGRILWNIGLRKFSAYGG